MLKRLCSILILACTPVAIAKDKPDNWIEVRSPHFVIATNSNENKARRIADQFERMRAVFHALFPKLQIDPSSPIIVLAVKDDKDFRALEPQEYLAKGSLRLGGLFLRGPDKNYVLMRLDAEGEHPYAVIYHEYTHLLMAKADWIPLWMNEGLAEFYENTDIDGSDARLGQPSVGDIQFLRQNRLLPLPTLFAVDYNSPYYHEENKGSMFYAESWALMHYIQVKDYQQKANHLEQYADLLAKKVDPVTAATTAFGDLKKLEADLNFYVQQGRFSFFKMKTLTDVDDSAFKAEALAVSQAEALRADFLAYNRRTQDAGTLLDHVLQDDPNNVLAHETMGFLEFQQGHLDEAKKWYEQAVQLDSQSYLAHYYFAAISMRGPIEPAEEQRVENSLRQAIKLNPSFAPAFDRLAVFLGSRHRELDEAHTMGLMAVSLEPANVAYRVNVASVLMQMGQGEKAAQVLRSAAKLAKTPEENEFVTQALMHADEFSSAQSAAAEQQRHRNEENTDSERATVSSSDSPDMPKAPRLARRDFVPSGPHHFATGVIEDVHCDSSTIDLAVKTSAKTMNLHSDNYFRVQFSTLGFQPKGNLNPCIQLSGRPAKIEYEESADKSQTPRVLSIELHK